MERLLFGVVNLICVSVVRFGLGALANFGSCGCPSFVRLAESAIEFVLVFRIIHRQFEDLDAVCTR